ncbi:MAG: putative sedoheptulose 7-phosphate isomerase [Actinomycetia bacterium]|nr:putative sedoheptulose 7-phosphate isomerase [Actinomycetes bacterium]
MSDRARESTRAAEPTGFLYPFIDAEERDAGSLLAELAGSARRKIAESQAVRRDALRACAAMIDAAATAMCSSFLAGGRLFTFGNGGSATDARLVTSRFLDPPSGRALPSICLDDDRAVITALANDVGFDVVFARQLRAHARRGDIALGLSTSGGSANVLEAFAAAHDIGLTTVGLAGYDGGSMAVSGHVEHCLVVRSDSVHRIQEAQDALVSELWTQVQRRLDQVDPR